MTVAGRAEVVTAYCTACADELRTHQALCFQRSLAVGEVVGVARRGDRDTRAAA